MIWLALTLLVVVALVVVFVVTALWWGDRPGRDPEGAGDASSGGVGRRRMLRARRDASSGFPNMHG